MFKWLKKFFTSKNEDIVDAILEKEKAKKVDEYILAKRLLESEIKYPTPPRRQNVRPVRVDDKPRSTEQSRTSTQTPSDDTAVIIMTTAIVADSMQTTSHIPSSSPSYSSPSWGGDSSSCSSDSGGGGGGCD